MAFVNKKEPRNTIFSTIQSFQC